MRRHAAVFSAGRGLVFVRCGVAGSGRGGLAEGGRDGGAGDFAGVVEELVDGDGAGGFGEGRGWGFEEVVAEVGEGEDGGSELGLEGFGFGAEGEDACVVGLVVGDWEGFLVGLLGGWHVVCSHAGRALR